MKKEENPTTRTAIINQLIKENHLQTYLEIGAANPYENFLDIVCPTKVSVDSGEDYKYSSKESVELTRQFITYSTTPSKFFEQNTQKFDLIFIDGDHSYEQSLKNLNNALNILSVNGFVVLPNTCPFVFEETQLKNYTQSKPYTGEVWKTALSAVKQSKDLLMVKTFPWDWGVTVIKKLTDKEVQVNKEDLNWQKDFDLHALNPEYDVSVFESARVSYFTSAFNTPISYLSRTLKTLLTQTNPSWEWVVVDDSDSVDSAKKIEHFLRSTGDTRIKYFRYNQQSDGYIGEAKRRATSLCSGKYLAELDHDDLLMPDLTDKVLKYGEGFDFIYSNYSSVQVSETLDFSDGEHYSGGFGMGYGEYRTTQALNPLTGNLHIYNESIAVPINPKTIRHIVGVPNHIRIWNRDFYNKINRHNPNLWVVDDYELIVRSFLAGGRFLHLDFLGYLQVYDGTNTTDARRNIIQILVAAILTTYDKAIKKEFEHRGLTDWAYDYHERNFGFKTLHYWDVPNAEDLRCANEKKE